jgi:hypothetical protein
MKQVELRTPSLIQLEGKQGYIIKYILSYVNHVSGVPRILI